MVQRRSAQRMGIDPPQQIANPCSSRHDPAHLLVRLGRFGRRADERTQDPHRVGRYRGRYVRPALQLFPGTSLGSGQHAPRIESRPPSGCGGLRLTFRPKRSRSLETRCATAVVASRTTAMEQPEHADAHAISSSHQTGWRRVPPSPPRRTGQDPCPTALRGAVDRVPVLAGADGHGQHGAGSGAPSGEPRSRCCGSKPFGGRVGLPRGNQTGQHSGCPGRHHHLLMQILAGRAHFFKTTLNN